MTVTFIETILILGSLYGLVALSVCISYRFLGFPDLSIDGSFAIGAVVCARMLEANFPLVFATCAGMLSGCCAGLLTATLNRIFKISKLFAGILTTMIVYTISLRVLGGANKSMLEMPSFFEGADLIATIQAVTWCFVCAILGIAIFHTRLGLLSRAYAGNPDLLRWSPGRKWVQVAFTLGLSNMFAALAGCLVSQFQGFTDVSMGVGVTIGGFSAIFLGETIIVWLSRFGRNYERMVPRKSVVVSKIIVGEVSATIVGSYLLFLATTSVLYIGLPPSDLRLVSALIFVVALLLRRGRDSMLLVPSGKLDL